MKTLNVVAAIIKKDNKILATKRGYGEFINMWEFPGGKIEPNESKEDALIREIKEELNLSVVKHKFMSSRFHEPKDILMLNFIVVVEDTPIKLKADEIKEARWCTPEEALALIRKGTTAEYFLQNAVRELKKKI